MKRKLIISIISTLLIILWVYAALGKLSAFTQFSYQLKLQPIPKWSIPVVLWALPAVELCIAVLIYFQRTRMKGLILSTILMIIFTFYVLFALTGAYGEIPCSCAGLISALRWRGHLVFNLFFTVLSILGIIMQRHKDDDFVKHKLIAT